MIALNNITVSFGTRILLDDLSLKLGNKERIGLVGLNGSGKSTLMKIINGSYKVDIGSIIKSKHYSIGYLPQESVILEGRTLIDEMINSAGDIKDISDEIETMESELKRISDKNCEEYLDLFDIYAYLQERFKILEGHKLNSKIEKILLGLGFDSNDFGINISNFSGGWQLRIELAKLLLQSPSLLLLDEPTNSLDLNSLVWLENYLKSYNGSLVIVSHDRIFLDNLTAKTIEISQSKLNYYSGNYSYYETEKMKRDALRLKKFDIQQKYLQQQEKFINRFRYKATKARAVQSRIKLLEKIDLIEIDDDIGALNLKFPDAVHSGKISLEVENLGKSFGETKVLDGISFIVERGDKIAIVGRNGSGKSTLSKIIAGKEKPSFGSFKLGYNVIIKYYAQNQADELNPDLTIYETLEESNSNNNVNIRSILGCFLFKGDDVFKKIGVLSGGEKSRVALAKMITEPSNFMILDEPTNHLDMISKNILKQALLDYNGSIMIVSHDRDFTNDIANKVIEIKNNKIRLFEGNLSYYLYKIQFELDEDSAVKKNDNDISKDVKNNVTSYIKGIELKKKKKQLIKVTSQIKQKIKNIEALLENLDKRKTEIETIMTNKDYFKDSAKVIKSNYEYRNLLNEILKLNNEWEIEVNKLSELEKNLIN